jgi:ferrous iron transport protein B
MVLLLGRPNSGKSSLYNMLTGGDAKVGNFPGITVDVLEADVTTDDGILRVVDLPGLYSIEAHSDPDSDEGQAWTFLEHARKQPGAVVAQIADLTHLALGLRLTRELCRSGLPVVLVLTQRDVLEAEGRTVDTDELERTTGIPVVAVSARDRADRARLLDLFTSDGARRPHGTTSFDPDVVAARVIKDRVDAGAQERARRTLTERVDTVLLHPFLGPVVFVTLMTFLFSAVFFIAHPVSSAIDAATRVVSVGVTRILGEGMLGSLIVDGVLGGAGTVLAFLPQIVILTVALELVDASGYLARGAYLVDRLLGAAGLGGRSFVPLLTAHACAIPAIGATRIIRDPGQRLRTILVLPLMTCSARIPTYGLLIETFFGAASPWAKAGIFVSLYFASIVLGLIASLVIGKTVERAGRSLPLVLEMPSYRMPQARVIARTAARSCKRFLKEVGTGILVASLALWVLLTVPWPGADAPVPDGASPRVAAMHRSVAAHVGRALEPITEHAGFDWRVNVGLVGSFGARELMVSTMGVIFGMEDPGDDPAPLVEKIREAKAPDGRAAYTPATGLALMAFFVVACQCISTVVAIRRETRSLRWPAFVLAYTYLVGFVAAVLVRKVAELAGLG